MAARSSGSIPGTHREEVSTEALSSYVLIPGSCQGFLWSLMGPAVFHASRYLLAPRAGYRVWWRNKGAGGNTERQKEQEGQRQNGAACAGRRGTRPQTLPVQPAGPRRSPWLTSPVIVSFAVQKFLSLMYFHLYIFDFAAYAFAVIFKK